MIRKKLERYLAGEGFYPLPSNVSEINAFIKIENNLLNILQLVDYSDNLYLSSEQMKDVKQEIIEVFRQRGVGNVHVLSLVMTNNVERARVLMQEESFAWYVDLKTDELVIDEGKASDFYGMKGMLQTFLSTYKDMPDVPDKEEHEADIEFAQKEKKKQFIKERAIKFPYVSTVIVVINLIIFLLCINNMPYLYFLGCVGLDLVMDGQWYRMITSMFLHADIDHIFGNMLLLYCLGDLLEFRLGRVKFTTIYFISGILGNVISCFYEYYANVSYVSYGASGAVFGLIGVTAFLVLNGEKSIGIPIPRMLLMVVYCIYTGFVENNVNVAAHIGGLLAGYLCMLIVGIRKEKA